jgi:hypothetical protein
MFVKQPSSAIMPARVVSFLLSELVNEMNDFDERNDNILKLHLMRKPISTTILMLAGHYLGDEEMTIGTCDNDDR